MGLLLRSLRAVRAKEGLTGANYPTLSLREKDGAPSERVRHPPHLSETHYVPVGSLCARITAEQRDRCLVVAALRAVQRRVLP